MRPTTVQDAEHVFSSTHKALGLEQDPTLHLPRILCLHGGGTNARIFRTQCRALRARLAPFFRLVFADAPFLSQPGPDVTSVYANWGPFRSWLRPMSDPGLGFVADAAVVEKIGQSIDAAIRDDSNAGATGDFIGLLGFSQGAKLAASLLLKQQSQMPKRKCRNGGYSQDRTLEMEPRFAVLLAGRAPLVSMDIDRRNCLDALPATSNLLRLPTIHVHGLRDAAISMHRKLLYQCCEESSTRLVEWNGDHRVPIKSEDVDAVVAEILDVVKEYQII